MSNSHTQFRDLFNNKNLQYRLWRPNNWVSWIEWCCFLRTQLPWLCLCSCWSWWYQCTNRFYVLVWWYSIGFHWSRWFDKGRHLSHEGLCTLWWNRWGRLDSLHSICNPRHHCDFSRHVWSWNTDDFALDIPWRIANRLQYRRSSLLSHLFN